MTDHFQVRPEMGPEYTEQLLDGCERTRIDRMRQYIDIALTKVNKPSARLLDVGCADGAIVAPFASRASLHGLDVNATFAEGAKKRGFDVRIVDFEKDKFPHESGTFDVLTSGETIEHVVNTDWFMTEINRVMKDGGIAVFSVPNINQLISLPMMLFFDLPPRYSARFRAPHVRDFTPRTFRKCLRAFGFEVLESCGTGFFVPGFKRHLATRVSKLNPFLAAEMVFMVRKVETVAYDASRIVDFGETPKIFERS